MKTSGLGSACHVLMLNVQRGSSQVMKTMRGRLIPRRLNSETWSFSFSNNNIDNTSNMFVDSCEAFTGNKATSGHCVINVTINSTSPKRIISYLYAPRDSILLKKENVNRIGEMV